MATYQLRGTTDGNVMVCGCYQGAASRQSKSKLEVTSTIRGELQSEPSGRRSHNSRHIRAT